MMKILVVDDNAEDRYLLEVLLKAHGHAVIPARNGLEALERLRREPVGLIVSDILMPSMDGYRLCREVKQDDRLRNIPFVFVTSSYTEEKDEQFARALGAEHFIRRPVDPDVFMHIINEAAKGTSKAPANQLNGEYFSAYAERVVNKLEEKIAALESEISARRRAETALRESEEKFRGFAEAATQVFWIMGVLPERVVYANPSFERIWGRSVNELYENPHLWLETVHPDDHARVTQAFEQWRRGLPKARYELEYRIVTPEGAVRWISDYGFVIPSHGDRTWLIAGIAEDITQRKRAEEALRENEERYRSLTAALVEGVILMDAQGEIQACNASAQRMLGVEVGGRSVFDPRSPPIDENGVAYAADAYPQNVSLRTGKPCHGVVMGLIRVGGVIWLSVNAQPLWRPGTETPYAVVESFTDITQQRLLERELQHQARIDPLTGIANRRHFINEAEQSIALSRRYRHALSLLMIDIDRFKAVNDTYGHHVGDIALQTLTRVCQAELRDVDMIGRIGGEEFAVLLPETGAERALYVAERLRQAVANAVVRTEANLIVRFTISIGVATLHENDISNDISVDVLLQRADQALYVAKESGRNAVRMAIPETSEVPHSPAHSL